MTTALPTDRYGQTASFTENMPPVRPPVKPPLQAVDVCPCCKQALPSDSGVGQLTNAARTLFGGLLLVVTSVLRLVRFVVAGAFYFVGSIGGFFRAVGARLAHPADREKLETWRMER